MVAAAKGFGYEAGMNARPTTLERAFALARSGEYPGVAEIKAKLKAEGFALQQLEGRTLLRQLRDICIASQQAKPQEETTATDDAV